MNCHISPLSFTAGCVPAAAPADIGSQAGDTDDHAGVLLQPCADGLNTLAVLQSSFNLGPERPDLAGFGVRLFRALLREAATGFGNPIVALFGFMVFSQKTALIYKGNGRGGSGRQRRSIFQFCGGLRQDAANYDGLRRLSRSTTICDRLRRIATTGSQHGRGKQPKSRVVEHKGIVERGCLFYRICGYR